MKHLLWIKQAIEKVFDLRPGAIIRDLKLRRPIFSKTAAYGHFGRQPNVAYETQQGEAGRKEFAYDARFALPFA